MNPGAHEGFDSVFYVVGKPELVTGGVENEEAAFPASFSQEASKSTSRREANFPSTNLVFVALGFNFSRQVEINRPVGQLKKLDGRLKTPEHHALLGQ